MKRGLKVIPSIVSFSTLFHMPQWKEDWKSLSEPVVIHISSCTTGLNEKRIERRGDSQLSTSRDSLWPQWKEDWKPRQACPQSLLHSRPQWKEDWKFLEYLDKRIDEIKPQWKEDWKKRAWAVAHTYVKKPQWKEDWKLWYPLQLSFRHGQSLNEKRIESIRADNEHSHISELRPQWKEDWKEWRPLHSL